MSALHPAKLGMARQVYFPVLLWLLFASTGLNSLAQVSAEAGPPKGARNAADFPGPSIVERVQAAIRDCGPNPCEVYIQPYSETISDPDRHRPDHCPQCAAQHPLTAHGFYSRTVTDVEFDGFIRVRRYLCHCCKRTVSLLPEFALPYLRFSIFVIALFLIARLLNGCTLQAAAQAAAQPGMPYQRGQFWVRRFQTQAAGLCAALAALTAPMAAPNF